jgi:antitoxin (DNA-binding transcriptional repressor) of toxin-antitoxin stability system
MGKHVVHILEDEAAATSVATLLAHVRAGAQVIIENGMRPVAILLPAEPAPRKISECIALLPEDSTATIDADFAKDAAAAVEYHREPLSPPLWD